MVFSVFSILSARRIHLRHADRRYLLQAEEWARFDPACTSGETVSRCLPFTNVMYLTFKGGREAVPSGETDYTCAVRTPTHHLSKVLVF